MKQRNVWSSIGLRNYKQARANVNWKLSTLWTMKIKWPPVLKLLVVSSFFLNQRELGITISKTQVQCWRAWSVIGLHEHSLIYRNHHRENGNKLEKIESNCHHPNCRRWRRNNNEARIYSKWLRNLKRTHQVLTSFRTSCEPARCLTWPNGHSATTKWNIPPILLFS